MAKKVVVMGKKSRDKGHNYEREIAKRLRPLFPQAQRHLEYQQGEANGVDLANTGNLSIQCKRFKNYASITRIFEVQEVSGKIPVLVTKGDRLPDMVVLSLDDFLAILDDVGVAYGD